MRACWNELFTLGLAQCAQVMSLSTILAAIVNHLQNSIQEGTFSVCDSATCSVLSTLRWRNLLSPNYQSSDDLQLFLHQSHRDLCGIQMSIEEARTRLEEVFCLLHLTGSREKDKHILKLNVLTELSSHPDLIFFFLLE